MTVLVTGAAGGIGTAIVRSLAARGTSVVAQDLTHSSLQHLEHGSVELLEGDLRTAECRASIHEALRRRDVAAVIAAHGVDGSGELARLDPKFVRRVLEINAATIPDLLATVDDRLVHGGRFVVIASQAGLRGEAENSAYCASKFAVVAWVQTIAPAMLRRGIHVRALCPGCTETPLLYAAHERFAAARGLDGAQFLADRKARIPIARFASTDETAAAAIYLADSGERPTVLAVTGGEVPF